MEILMHVCLLSVIVAAALFHYVKSQGDGLSLLCTYIDKIRKVDLEAEEYTDIVTNLEWAVTIDYHYKKGLIIWGDTATEKISSFVLGSNGPVTEIVDVCVQPVGVAVDWIHDNLYWIDSFKGAIGVARLDGSLVKTLFDKDITRPEGIVIDPLEGLIFWTKGHYSLPKMERSGMDGTHRTAILSRGIQLPYALTIDWISQSIYWTNGRSSDIFTCNYNGTNVRIIISFKKNVQWPRGIDILGDWLYFHLWSHYESNVYKTNKDGVGDMIKVIDGKNWTWSYIFGLKVYDSSKQIPGENRCVNNGGCSHLCLPAPLRFIKDGDLRHSCLCPDDVLYSDNCSTIPKDIPLTTTVIFSEETSTYIKLNDETASSGNYKNGQSKTTNSFPTGTIIGTFFGLVILALIVFYLYKRFWKRSGQEVVTVQSGQGISNPVYGEIPED